VRSAGSTGPETPRMRGIAMSASGPRSAQAPPSSQPPPLA
jgi:hypothetical protein